MCGVPTEIIFNVLLHLDLDSNQSEGTQRYSAYISEHLPSSVSPSLFHKSKNNFIFKFIGLPRPKSP